MTVVNASTTPAQGINQGAAGLSPEVYIRRLRARLRDRLRIADEQITPVTGQTKYTVNPPINNDDYFKVTQVSPAITYAIVTDIEAMLAGTMPANSVYVDFDSGILVFQAAPSASTNNVYVQKTRGQWRNDELMEALEAGVRALWPKCKKEGVDESVVDAVNQWDYTLPFWATDPRVNIYEVEMREIPAATNRFFPIRGAYREGLTTLKIPQSQRYSPGASVRIKYQGPYIELSELPAHLANLPVLYATAVLLGNDESKRTRLDDQKVVSDVNANPVGARLNAGSFFMKQFYQELELAATVTKAGRFAPTWRR